jgi:hypothetical protein
VAGVEELGRLEAVLEGAALWGLELDPRFRVLAATFEPTAARYPWEGADDRRLQVLLFPVSTILASLRQREQERLVVRRFADDQLVDVVAAFAGAAVEAPLFGRPEPRPGQWAPEWSLEGRSSAPDGIRHTCTVSLRQDDLELDLFVRFDDVELKDVAGDDLSLPAGGRETSR